MTSTATFFSELHEGCEGLVEFRSFSASNAPTGRAFLPIGDASRLTSFFGHHLQDHVFFSVATRQNDSSGSGENLAHLPALFVDVDYKDIPELDARKRLNEFPFPPTAVVSSGGGLHFYWQLAEPVDLHTVESRQHVRDVLRRLATFLGGDMKAAEPARILRLPGSMNVKYTPPRQAKVETFDPSRRYQLSEFEDLLPPFPQEPAGQPFTAPHTIADGCRNDTLYRAGRSLKAKGLSREAVTAALDAENRVKCTPPLDPEEMSRIIESVWTQPDAAAFRQNGAPHIGLDSTETVVEPEEDLDPTPPPFEIVTPPESFVTKYIQYAAQRTDAPVEAHEAFGFAVLSAMASPVRLPIATSPRGWSLNLWLLYLVNSTAGRKSTTLDLSTDLIREVLGDASLLTWEGSPQGLLQRLQTRDGHASIFVRDEFSGLLSQMNRNGHLSSLPQLFIKAYDGAVLENIRTRKRSAEGVITSDTDRVEKPYFLQLAAAPWDAFIARATIDNVLDGFLARFAMVTGTASGRPLPLLTPKIRTARQVLLDMAKRYRDLAAAIEQVVIAPGVLSDQWELEQRYLKKAEHSVCPEAAGPSMKRLAETALKLAGLLAIEETRGSVMTLTEAHFAVGQQIADRWAISGLKLIEAVGRTSFQRDCERVLATIRQHPRGIPIGELYRRHKRMKHRDFHEAVTALEEQGELRRESVAPQKQGRPTSRVYPMRRSA